MLFHAFFTSCKYKKPQYQKVLSTLKKEILSTFQITFYLYFYFSGYFLPVPYFFSYFLYVVLLEY